MQAASNSVGYAISKAEGVNSQPHGRPPLGPLQGTRPGLSHTEYNRLTGWPAADAQKRAKI